ncbi:hypothetical protein Asi02nite_75550 [Asanoa siamensis]|uniref:Secreted protein n=2 Tax=Asanoa siamensis TaxID=926357 RepID=A0ABQ4D4J6_9ACTN|nr:hypothetical protein Asi02nite_75550 [Asanoa siamensis]
MARWRTVVVRLVTVSLSLLTAATVAAQPVQAAAVPPAQAAGIVGQRHGEMWWTDPSGPYQLLQATYLFTVYNDHKKELMVCDQRIDTFRVFIEIDPTGVGSPDTLRYPDANDANPGCSRFTFYYPVRKWRPQLLDIYDNVYFTPWPTPNGPKPPNDGWQISPLPRSDF